MSENKDVTIKDVITEMKKHNRKSDSKLIMRAYNYAVAHMVIKSVNQVSHI